MDDFRPDVKPEIGSHGVPEENPALRFAFHCIGDSQVALTPSHSR